MTVQQAKEQLGLVIKMIAWRSPAGGIDTASAEKVAGDILETAVRKVGRMQGVAFNRDNITFALTSGLSSYQIGKDLFKKYPAIWNMEYLWMNQAPGQRCYVVELDTFNEHARGNTVSGYPKYATIHSKDKTIEFWPSPNGAYSMIAYAKENIEDLNKIPVDYHDLVLAVGYEFIHAAHNPSAASKLAREGRNEVQADSQTGYSGSTFPVQRHLGRTASTSRTKADSFNVTGE